MSVLLSNISVYVCVCVCIFLYTCYRRKSFTCLRVVGHTTKGDTPGPTKWAALYTTIFHMIRSVTIYSLVSVVNCGPGGSL